MLKDRNIEVQYNIEFQQFISKIKTNWDNKSEGKQYLDSDVLTVLLTSFIARYFYICDDRQFYLIKSYLIDLFNNEFKNKDELYKLNVSSDIFNMILDGLNSKQQNAVINLFGKGNIFPFNEPPVIVFNENAYEDNGKPFQQYIFKLNIKGNKVTYKFKMPIFNPTMIFTPLALAYIIEYVFLNIDTEESFHKVKKTIIDLLTMIVDRKFNESHIVNGVLIKNNIL